MKYLAALVLTVSSFSAYSAGCPDLQGRYPKCKSEIRDIKGEYIVEQYMKDDVNYYQIHYIDDETNETRTEAIKTDGSLDSRKERLPRVGVTVRIDSRSKCVGDSVQSEGDVYFMGAKVGHVTNKVYRTGDTLHSDLNGSYLGKAVTKQIVCTQE